MNELLNKSALREANEMFRRGSYAAALHLYQECLKDDYPEKLASSVHLLLDICKKRQQPETKYVGLREVSNIDAALADMARSSSSIALRKGITALVRAKNADRFLFSAIESVKDIVDEVVVIDNNSSDSTWDIVREFEISSKNVFGYQYKIDVPRVGAQHELETRKGSPNTLATFYNWCLSKVRTNFVLKWDADFICLKKNLSELITAYNLKEEEYEKAIWCTGLTAYNGTTINLGSAYDEYRIFSKKHGAKWDNWRGCETLTPSISRSPRLYINPSQVNVKHVDKENLKRLKELSRPVFIEIKDFQNKKPEDMLLDNRDVIDNKLISLYCRDDPKYRLPNKINDYHVLIMLPNLKAGGGNYWAKHVYSQLNYVGIKATVGGATVSHHGKAEDFHGIPMPEIFDWSKDPDRERLARFSHIILTCDINVDIDLIPSKVFLFTHSDISYFNKFITENSQHSSLCLNKATEKKLSNLGIKTRILHNYLPIKTGIKHEKRNDHNREFRVLYCNRISPDKNVLMLLFAIKIAEKAINGLKLTLLAGGSEDSPYEFQQLKVLTKALNLESVVTLFETQRNVDSFYHNAHLVVLPSVSEGCSYGLLESINHEVPVLSTAIQANTEVTREKALHVQFDGLQKRIDELTYVEPGKLYTNLLETIGYLSQERILEISQDGGINYNILDSYYKQFGFNYKEKKGIFKVICPILLNADIIESTQSNKLLHSYIIEQKNIFLKNVDALSKSIIYAKENYIQHAESIQDLKLEVSATYFDQRNSLQEILSALNLDELDFVNIKPN